MCFIATSNLLSRQLVNSSTRFYVTMSSSQATCLLVDSSTRQLVNLSTYPPNPGSKLSSHDC